MPIAKSRTIMVRLISMAMTGYYRTMQRPRVHQPLSMLKYDPIGMPLLRNSPQQPSHIMHAYLHLPWSHEHQSREEKPQDWLQGGQMRIGPKNMG